MIIKKTAAATVGFFAYPLAAIPVALVGIVGLAVFAAVLAAFIMPLIFLRLLFTNPVAALIALVLAPIAVIADAVLLALATIVTIGEVIISPFRGAKIGWDEGFAGLGHEIARLFNGDAVKESFLMGVAASHVGNASTNNMLQELGGSQLLGEELNLVASNDHDDYKSRFFMPEEENVLHSENPKPTFGNRGI